MGCRTWAFWIIPTLQLFVWRTSAKLCILKQKGERERGGEAAVEERDPFCQGVQANSTSWLESLTGSHPVWVSSKRRGGCIWLQRANKCHFQMHFLRVPLAETLPRLEVNVSYSYPKKLRNLKHTHTNTQNKKKDTLEGFPVLWVSSKDASILWGCTKDSKDSVPSELFSRALGINIKGTRISPWRFPAPGRRCRNRGLEGFEHTEARYALGSF